MSSYDYSAELAEIDQLIAADEFFSAAAKVGVILAALEHGESERFWQTEGIRRSLGDWEDLRRESLARSARISRVVSGGQTFDEDEILLVLTLRVQLAAVDLLSQRAFGRQVDIPEQAEIDSAIRAISTSNASAYRRANRAIQRNWRSHVPFSVEKLGLAGLIE